MSRSWYGFLKHDDHYDYLVHVKNTGRLHLEHLCNDCGDHDFHGKFDLVGKRQCREGVQVHFYRPPQRRFSYMNLFEPESDRVQEALKMPLRKERTASNSSGMWSVGSDKTSRREKTANSVCGVWPAGPDKASVIEGLFCVKCKPKPIPKPIPKPSCCASGACSSKATCSTATNSTCCSSGSCKGVTKPSCCSNGSCSTPTHESLSCCSGGNCNSRDSGCFSSSNDSAIGLEPQDIGGKKNLVRSTIRCAGICCSSEVPAVRRSLAGVGGAEKVMINVPLKHVIVDHDPNIVSAAVLADILNHNDFGATIVRDGGIAKKGNSRGKSRFHVDKICCASEIPAINAIIYPINRCFRKRRG